MRLRREQSIQSGSFTASAVGVSSARASFVDTGEYVRQSICRGPCLRCVMRRIWGTLTLTQDEAPLSWNSAEVNQFGIDKVQSTTDKSTSEVRAGVMLGMVV